VGFVLVPAPPPALAANTADRLNSTNLILNM
jgi:hypothetical protein